MFHFVLRSAGPTLQVIAATVRPSSHGVQIWVNVAPGTRRAQLAHFDPRLLQ